MVLTACGAFEMHVMLGESKAEEFAPVAGCAPCDGFIEANLFVKGVSYQKEEVETDPFGETFTQAWPVTPYKVRVSNHSNEQRWIRVYVDGEQAYGCSINAGETRVLEGKQSQPDQGASAIHELLFARPRLVRRDENVDAPVDPAKLGEFESVRLDVHACTRGEETRGTKRGASGGFDGVNKAICKKAKAGAMTRTGGVVKRSLGAASSTTLTTYTVNEVLDTVRIRYAQKDRLVTFGVWPDDDSDEEAGDKKRAKLSKEG